jgi:hypothetical protein
MRCWLLHPHRSLAGTAPGSRRRTDRTPPCSSCAGKGRGCGQQHGSRFTASLRPGRWLGGGGEWAAARTTSPAAMLLLLGLGWGRNRAAAGWPAPALQAASVWAMSADRKISCSPVHARGHSDLVVLHRLVCRADRAVQGPKAIVAVGADGAICVQQTAATAGVRAPAMR